MSLIDCGGNGFDFLDCAVFGYIAGGLGHSGPTFGTFILNVFASLSVSLNRSSKLGKLIEKTSPPIFERSSEIENKNLWACQMTEI
jgi:hypothetical protein